VKRDRQERILEDTIAGPVSHLLKKLKER